MKEKNHTKIFSFNQVIVEFVAIFVGLYLAFMLNNFQLEIEESKQRLVYIETFSMELKELSRRLKGLNEYLSIEIAQTDSLLKVQKRIQPTFLYFSPNISIVDAAFNSDSFDALGHQLTFSLSTGRAGIQHISTMINQYNVLVISLSENYSKNIELLLINLQKRLIQQVSNFHSELESRALPYILNEIKLQRAKI
jgi:hypothetical protein